MDRTWQALAREAGLASEHLAIGITALGRANYAHHAHYGQAFFALSVGIERSCKLGITVDHAMTHKGQFLSGAELKQHYGHNLQELLKSLEAIGYRRGLTNQWAKCPDSPIHIAAIEILSKFATNVTRYFNLEYVAGSHTLTEADDPIASWYERVTKPIVALHMTAARREKIDMDARIVHEMVSDHVLVRFHSETGEDLGTAYLASQRTGETEFARRWEQLYLLQIARFMGFINSEIGYRSGGLPNIPDLGEFYRIYYNSDTYFRSRGTWSIYGR